MSGQGAASFGQPHGGYTATPSAGSGPGILLLDSTDEHARRSRADAMAAEGYVVFAPTWGGGDTEAWLDAALETLRKQPGQAGKVGALGFGQGGRAALELTLEGRVDCAVAYHPEGVDPSSERWSTLAAPCTVHVGEDGPGSAGASGGRGSERLTVFSYPQCGADFSLNPNSAFERSAASMARSRSLALFRSVLGPHYDLSVLWDAHTAYEFAERDVDATMATMVAEPYVNHIPTMTGGVGHDHLARFYREHFVFSNPPDTHLIPISRTVGVDRVVDEMLFCFTHTCEVPWMLPGVPPTGKSVEIPLVAIVNFRGDKLCHEHIYWDQASVLAQIGWLDPEGLPIAGAETARKLLDETLPSNELMERRLTEPG